jgi:hypothetical protein
MIISYRATKASEQTLGKAKFSDEHEDTDIIWILDMEAGYGMHGSYGCVHYLATGLACIYVHWMYAIHVTAEC